MWRRSTLLVLVGLGAPSCDTGLGDEEGDNGPSASCLEAATRSDLDFIQEEILTPSCAASSACHKGDARSAAGLNLEAGNSLLNMLNIPSELVDKQGQTMFLVTPGQPTDSYLQLVLDNSRPELIVQDVGLMPYRSRPLCEEKIDAVTRWITSLEPTDP